MHNPQAPNSMHLRKHVVFGRLLLYRVTGRTGRRGHYIAHWQLFGCEVWGTGLHYSGDVRACSDFGLGGFLRRLKDGLHSRDGWGASDWEWRAITRRGGSGGGRLWGAVECHFLEFQMLWSFCRGWKITISVIGFSGLAGSFRCDIELF